jgi:uncharacterized phage protein (TIGR02218 family)
MPKDIDADKIKYFFQSGITALTGYIFSLPAGTQRFIANTADVHDGSNTYTALAIKRNPIRSEEGTILNELEIGLDHVDLTFKNDVMSGKYNDVPVSIYLIIPELHFTGEYWSVAADMLLFKGFTDEPKGDEHWITLSVKPFPYLDQQYPKRIYQTGCNWTFCGTGCNLDIGSFKTNVNLSGVSDGITLTCSHGQAADYFTPGYVEIKGGALTGQVRPILTNTTGTVVVRIPFDDTIASGVNVDVVKLCAKNYETCDIDFSNYSEYGGYPWVPKEPII